MLKLIIIAKSQFCWKLQNVGRFDYFFVSLQRYLQYTVMLWLNGAELWSWPRDLLSFSMPLTMASTLTMQYAPSPRPWACPTCLRAPTPTLQWSNATLPPSRQRVVPVGRAIMRRPTKLFCQGSLPISSPNSAPWTFFQRYMHCKALISDHNFQIFLYLSFIFLSIIL